MLVTLVSSLFGILDILISPLRSSRSVHLVAGLLSTTEWGQWWCRGLAPRRDNYAFLSLSPFRSWEGSSYVKKVFQDIVLRLRRRGNCHRFWVRVVFMKNDDALKVWCGIAKGAICDWDESNQILPTRVASYDSNRSKLSSRAHVLELKFTRPRRSETRRHGGVKYVLLDLRIKLLT